MHRKDTPKKRKSDLLVCRRRARNSTFAAEADAMIGSTSPCGCMVKAKRDRRPLCLPKLAIRAYPPEYLRRWNLTDGTPVTVRTVRPDDEPLIVAFHKSLSEEAVHFRYFGLVKLEARIRDECLTRTCFNNYSLVVESLASGGDSRQIIGEASLINVDVYEAECAIVISDEWQGRGIGTKLLGHLIGIGRTEGLACIFGYILPDNYTMQRICRKLGFKLRFDASQDLFEARIQLWNTDSS